MNKQVQGETEAGPASVERIRWSDLVPGAIVIALCALILLAFAANAARVRAGSDEAPRSAGYAATDPSPHTDPAQAQPAPLSRLDQAEAARWEALAAWYASQAEPLPSPTCVPPVIQIEPGVWGCVPRE